MERERYIGKYCNLVNNHYETALQISEMEICGIAGESMDEKRTMLKEELEQTRSQLVEVREELEKEDFDRLLRVLLE